MLSVRAAITALAGASRDQVSHAKVKSLSHPPHGPREHATQTGISWYTTGQVQSARWVTGQQG
jgi:hypothetical protein